MKSLSFGCAFAGVRQSQVSSNSKSLGFTLAEVLITLGIIGVVAAITMPTLFSNVQDRVKQKRVENIKQKLSKVTDKMAVQSGMIGYGNTMSFVQEMSKHMKIAKICDNNHISDCWPTQEVDLNNDGKMWKITKTKTAKNLKISSNIKGDWADTVGIITADGTAMILSYDKDCEFDVDKSGLTYNKSSLSNSVECLSGVFDWNGGKKPNKLGQDVLTFGKAAGLGNACAVEVNGKCFTAPFTPSSLSFAECEAEKDKLGIKACTSYSVISSNAEDYWAGAVKACGGVQNMPTPADLVEIASLVYKGNPHIAPDGWTDGLEIDEDKATSLGYTGTSFSIWSNQENGSRDASIRFFDQSYTGAVNTGAYGNRGTRPGTLAICIGE